MKLNAISICQVLCPENMYKDKQFPFSVKLLKYLQVKL